jgi:hypothetical protein
MPLQKSKVWWPPESSSHSGELPGIARPADLPPNCSWLVCEPSAFAGRDYRFRPGGAQGCSHGWSAAKPVVMGGAKSSIPEGRRKFGDVIRQRRFRCPCRGKPHRDDRSHGFRVGRLCRRAAPPVATFRRPIRGGRSPSIAISTRNRQAAALRSNLVPWEAIR